MAGLNYTPRVLVIGGPNGAGKSTVAGGLLKDHFVLGEFVNADTIASGLSAFAPERAALAAGRVMLTRLKELAASRKVFAFETTMASRSFAPFLERLKSGEGYEVHTVFMFLATPELAIRRVRQRVRAGGHSIPDEVVVRRYGRGISNFVRMYLPLSTSFRVYDNSLIRRPNLVAWGTREAPVIVRPDVWERILEIADESSETA